MVQIPSELKYTNDHEWLSEEGEVVSIGISDLCPGLTRRDRLY